MHFMQCRAQWEREGAGQSRAVQHRGDEARDTSLLTAWPDQKEWFADLSGCGLLGASMESLVGRARFQIDLANRRTAVFVVLSRGADSRAE